MKPALGPPQIQSDCSVIGRSDFVDWALTRLGSANAAPAAAPDARNRRRVVLPFRNILSLLACGFPGIIARLCSKSMRLTNQSINETAHGSSTPPSGLGAKCSRFDRRPPRTARSHSRVNLFQAHRRLSWRILAPQLRSLHETPDPIGRERKCERL